jgi:3',5'-nucleoside bisphosphate phosphatase
MLIEMHCHTAEHSSCSSVSAVELVQQVYAKKLQGLVLTDHHFLWSDADLAELRRKAGMPDHFIILSGQETNVPTFGDVLVYGAPVTIPRGTPLSEIRRSYPDVALVWAHPYRDGRIPERELLCSPLLNGVEIFNSNHTVRGNSRGFHDWNRYHFTATGGTDTHGASYAGIYPTLFDPLVGTVAELASAIAKGLCRPFFKEVSHREASKVTEVTIGTAARGKPRESVIIRTSADHAAWGKAERAFHIMTAIAAGGFDRGLFRVPQPLEKNAESKILIEEGLGGASLFEKLLSSKREERRAYLRLAARWLARLHGLRLQITTPEEFLAEEARRLDGELARFDNANHPYRGKVAEIVAAVKDAEQVLAREESSSFVQGHGDYHPKNILIGQDNPEDRATLYLAGIDFERSQFMPPAFDVGWFLAQLRSQLAAHGEIRADLSEEDFIEAYAAEAADALPVNFLRQVELFRARTNISIAALFIKLGLEKSTELWRILVEAERALTYLG